MVRYVIKSRVGYLAYVRANSCAWNPEQRRAARYGSRLAALETEQQVYIESRAVSDKRGMKALKIRIVRLVPRAAKGGA